MLNCPLLALASLSALVALDSEAVRISVIVATLQDFAKLDGSLESTTIHFLITSPNHIKDLAIELRLSAREGRHSNNVVVNTGIDEDAACRLPLVESIDSQVLHVDRRDLDVKVLAQDTQLDATAPRVFASDPFAIGCGLFFKHACCVELWVCLDCLCNDAAKLSHAVEGGAEDCRRQSAEHAAVVVRHYAEDQLAVKVGYGDQRWIRVQRVMLLASEVEGLVCTFRREIAGLMFRCARVRAGKGRSSGRMILTRKRVGECSL